VLFSVPRPDTAALESTCCSTADIGDEAGLGGDVMESNSERVRARVRMWRW
jgi:hypothetical protein